MSLKNNLVSYYNQAIYAENRNQLELASQYYLKFYNEIRLLDHDERETDSYDWIRIATFFFDNQQYEKALYFSKKAIIDEKNDGLSIYVLSCNNMNIKKEELEWGLSYILKYPFFKESSTYFRILSDYIDIYPILQDVFEKIEYEFFNNRLVDSKQYVDYLRMMIDLEIKEENMPNARFYLRKWFLLDTPYINQTNNMVVYTLYLDDLDFLIKRKNIIELLEQVEEETRFFYFFATNLSNIDEISNEIEFRSYKFTNPLLQEKQGSYKKLLAVMHGKEIKSLPHKNDWTEFKAFLLSYGLGSLDLFKSKFSKFADLDEAISFYMIFMNQIKPQIENSLEDVSVTVVGGGNKIGGSCIVLTVGDSHLMIDAGSFVNTTESQIIDFTSINERGITLEDIDALIITHAHMDHIGSIPFVHQQCEDLPMFATSQTKQLMWLMLREQEKFDQELRVKSLVDKCLVNITEVNKEFTINSKEGKWEIKLIESGHIRGAISLLIKKNGKTIFVTGDYSVLNQRTVKGLRIPDDIQADIVITESTYGFYPTSASISRERQEAMFITELLSVIERGGTVLIPAFALGRAQEIISIIQHNLQISPFPIYLDGMVCHVTELYDRFMRNDSEQHCSLMKQGIIPAKNIYQKIGFDNFVEQIVDKEPSCIIASSGMLYEGTKSMEYAKKLLGNSKNAIIFTGYLDEESPGFAVTKSLSNIPIEGGKIEVSADILSLRLSAHANREEIVQTILSLNPKHVILVHGDPNRNYHPNKMIASPFPSITTLIKKANINVIQSENGQTYDFRKED
ncbi:INTS11 family MBL fold metallo-hydrolase [Ureibacillus acetophenoni]|uniref:Cft2 family RNA processing exonuclease n=1 Tax=Ureibacillus acetophenoni TaxID=614649 RepID=A0A285U576_9BACL|nr:MBL fold metallo-hydrolase [Ureibacillus acetophenoni]SOC37085.1 Cft2 family RNA processing exonuclease [Ureibacillus acetophenoni]